MKKLVLLLAIVIILPLTACKGKLFNGEKGSDISGISNGNGETPDLGNECPKDDENIIRITAVGDVIVHDTQIDSQYDESTDSYDFTDNFKHVEEYIKESDLAIANLETTLSGKEKGFSGFPLFNSPDEIVDAIKYSGFDVVSAANNHIIDRGLDGLLRTAEVIKDKDLDLVGIKSKAKDKTYVVKEVKGVKLGISNYVFETPKRGGKRAINSIVIPNKALDLVDTFNYSELEDNYKDMEERIAAMKSEGAEVIIFLMHWGNEYDRHPNDYQKKISKKLADLGVDLIIGSHPHVIQPMEYISSEVSGKKTLVLYSLGNFLSNQRREILGDKYPEDGIIVNVDLKKQEDGSVNISEVSYIHTWVYRKDLGGEKYSYEILPLNELDEKYTFNIYDTVEIEKAKDSYNSTMAIFSEYNAQAVLAPKK